MKIAFYGRTATNLVHGWALEQAGHAVVFVEPATGVGLSDHDLAPVGPVLLDLLDARTQPAGVPIEAEWSPAQLPVLAADHDCELIVISQRPDRCGALAQALAPQLGGASVLFLGTFGQDPRPVLAALPADRLIWGAAVSGGGFTLDGELVGSLLPRLTFGTFGTEVSARAAAVRQVFASAGFALKEQSDWLNLNRLEFALNTGLAAQGLAVGDPEVALTSTGSLRRAILVIRECFQVAAAQGLVARDFKAEISPFYFPSVLGAMVLRIGLSNNRPALRVMVMQADEAEHLDMVRELLAEADRLKVAVPKLKRLYVEVTKALAARPA